MAENINRLYLVRHAEAEHGHPGQTDHQRALTAKGESVARNLGAFMNSQQFRPDIALISSSLRTCSTFDLMIDGGMARPDRVNHRDDLYLCGMDDLAEAISMIDDTCHQALIINHNPDISQLASWLCRSRHQETHFNDFAPGNMAVIEGGSWSGLRSGWGTLVHFIQAAS